MSGDKLTRADDIGERDFYRRLLELGACEEIGPLLQEALALAVEVTRADRAYLELFDDEGPPRFWCAHGLDTSDLAEVRASISRGIISRAVAAGNVIETASAVDD